eukprot:CAMPEP_0175887504 /NCGR_PEP_ID=MMETSP0107_2-20121207/46198_1 /TAXON_ID=195067 ORGANISM="Goniomonas pacifica, Strain CCMP1869" /NCGR_SAMPLE_ID=MMETSP0107_2 /ASSEMBLY_ACC=CAM_ASM_000203 /LENGTH=98 /DNA_ID=CAMNT_0017207943 /DNA_START=139 /DNA_END=435 /DNA_ORIENTATION=-
MRQNEVEKGGLRAGQELVQHGKPTKPETGTDDSDNESEGDELELNDPALQWKRPQTKPQNGAHEDEDDSDQEGNRAVHDDVHHVVRYPIVNPNCLGLH